MINVYPFFYAEFGALEEVGKLFYDWIWQIFDNDNLGTMNGEFQILLPNFVG